MSTYFAGSAVRIGSFADHTAKQFPLILVSDNALLLLDMVKDISLSSDPFYISSLVPE